jgi:hypothetical protein
LNRYKRRELIMEKPLARRLRDLRADFKDVMGEPFHHFYCPVLFLDDEAELCKAHIVNAVFPGSTRWTVQRKDVDNFYGHVFESDFVDIRHRGHRPDAVLADLELSKRLRPQVVVDGRRIEHYPVFQDAVGAQLFANFLDGPDERIEAHLTKYEGDRWVAAKEPTVLAWPKVDVGYPSA